MTARLAAAAAAARASLARGAGPRSKAGETGPLAKRCDIVSAAADTAVGRCSAAAAGGDEKFAAVSLIEDIGSAAPAAASAAGRGALTFAADDDFQLRSRGQL